MKKVTETNETENKYLISTKPLGTFLTAGLLLFGVASCNQGGGNQENTADNNTTTEQQNNEELGIEGTQNNEQVTNTDPEEFTRWDANTDQQWDRDEFNTRMSESQTFNDMDADQDGSINEDEFNRGSRYLQNNRMNVGNITADTAATDAGTTNNTYNFNDWDADQSGTVDQEEFNEGTFNQYDANQDGSLTNDEFNNTGSTGTEINSGTGSGTNTKMNE